MMGAKETEAILEQFFVECMVFWKHNGKTERIAFENALHDIEGIHHNPYEPHGDLLDIDAREKFIQYKKMLQRTSSHLK